VYQTSKVLWNSRSLQIDCFRSHFSLAGASRSVTVTVAYIMTVTGHSYRDTLTAVRQARPVANPNFGFKMQLQTFQDRQLRQVGEMILRQVERIF